MFGAVRRGGRGRGGDSIVGATAGARTDERKFDVRVELVNIGIFVWSSWNRLERLVCVVRIASEIDNVGIKSL